MKRGNKGFTLIELLVVIAIISILSSIVLSSLNNARSKARDAQRLSDLRQIRNALELYRDENGNYPIRVAAVHSNSVPLWSPLDTDLTEINLPVDPTNSGSFVFGGSTNFTYTYISSVSGSEYDLIARLENNHANACPQKDWITHAFAGGGSNWCTIFGPVVGDRIVADH